MIKGIGPGPLFKERRGGSGGVVFHSPTGFLSLVFVVLALFCISMSGVIRLTSAGRAPGSAALLNGVALGGVLGAGLLLLVSIWILFHQTAVLLDPSLGRITCLEKTLFTRAHRVREISDLKGIRVRPAGAKAFDQETAVWVVVLRFSDGQEVVLGGSSDSEASQSLAERLEELTQVPVEEERSTHEGGQE